MEKGKIEAAEKWAALGIIKSKEYAEWAYEYLYVLNTLNYIRSGMFKCSDERVKILEFQIEFLKLEGDDYWV